MRTSSSAPAIERPRSGRPNPDAALCATVSTPFPETIRPEDLIGALRSAASGGGAAAERWTPHLERLFAETPTPMVIRFYDRHPGELGNLAASYRWHVSRGGVRNGRLEAYLGERRG